MSDIVIEIIRATIVGFIFVYLAANKSIKKVLSIQGWNYILVGFGLIFFGMLIDITDNFESLDKFHVIGDTKYQAFLEKVVGYLLGFSVLAAGVCKWIPGIIELDSKRKLELSAASQEIKTLTGLLPICMDCKKIRDDSGYWNQLEQYLDEHSEAELSHGLCDECMEKRYPDSEEDR